MQLPIVSDVPAANSPKKYPTDSTSGVRGRYAIISLGCPKNLVDTEQMLGRLDQDGYQMVDSVDSADLVVINTCGFIDSAREESLGAIDEMLALKKQGKIQNVVVTGCLAERQQGKLLNDRPEIDAMIGVFGRNEIVSVIDRMRSHAVGCRRTATSFSTRRDPTVVRRRSQLGHAKALCLSKN